MMAQLMEENDELKKKKDLQKRINELAEENEQLKKSTGAPQRNVLASMACKFDDAVTTAVVKVSKIMVCAPADEDIFDPDVFDATSNEDFPSSGHPQDDENGVCIVGSASDEADYGKEVMFDAMDENTTNIQSAARTASYKMKMQAYNEKYHQNLPAENPATEMSEPPSFIDATLQEARLVTGEVVADKSMNEAMRRVEEAKQFVKNRSVLKTQTLNF